MNASLAPKSLAPYVKDILIAKGLHHFRTSDSLESPDSGLEWRRPLSTRSPLVALSFEDEKQIPREPAVGFGMVLRLRGGIDRK